MANGQQKAADAMKKLVCQYENVDFCFLIDATGSMQPYIDMVRQTIRDVVREVTTTTSAQGVKASSVRLAFVAYRDHCDAQRQPNGQFEVLNFTTNVEEFLVFNGRIQATGGGDEPEDVFGGLEKAIGLNWSSSEGTKVILHIADAPCHGVEFTGPNVRDDYPNGDPRFRSHTAIFGELRLRGVQYQFGRITPSTNLMIEKFSAAYGEPITQFELKLNPREPVHVQQMKQQQAFVGSWQHAMYEQQQGQPQMQQQKQMMKFHRATGAASRPPEDGAAKATPKGNTLLTPD